MHIFYYSDLIIEHLGFAECDKKFVCLENVHAKMYRIRVFLPASILRPSQAVRVSTIMHEFLPLIKTLVQFASVTDSSICRA